jgi:hypothetical protein
MEAESNWANRSIKTETMLGKYCVISLHDCMIVYPQAAEGRTDPSLVVGISLPAKSGPVSLPECHR